MVSSKQYQKALAHAMGIPVIRCIGLEVDIKHEDCIEVTARFHVTDEELEAAAKAVRLPGADGNG